MWNVAEKDGASSRDEEKPVLERDKKYREKYVGWKFNYLTLST